MQCIPSWRYSSTIFVRLSLSACVSSGLVRFSSFSISGWTSSTVYYIFIILYIFVIPPRILLIPLHLLRQFRITISQYLLLHKYFFCLLLRFSFFALTIYLLEFFYSLFSALNLQLALIFVRKLHGWIFIMVAMRRVYHYKCCKENRNRVMAYVTEYLSF